VAGHIFLSWSRSFAVKGKNVFGPLTTIIQWLQLHARGTTAAVKIREVGIGGGHLLAAPGADPHFESSVQRLLDATVNTLLNARRKRRWTGGRERQQYSGDGTLSSMRCGMPLAG